MSLIFRPMAAEDFERYRAASIKAYAEEQVSAGLWGKEQALARALATFDQILPQGYATPGHELHVVCRHLDSADIGHCWLYFDTTETLATGYIYDIEIHQDFQGLGYGRQTLKLIEQRARDLNCRQLGLSVFSTNSRARELYLSEGYAVRRENMTKPLIY